MRTAFRSMRRLFGLALVLAITLGVTAPAAFAQTEVTGSADFRNPPTLTPGTYADEIVTGETVWYGVIYRNDTPFRVDAKITTAGASSGLELVTTMVSPTLAEVASASGLLESSGVSARGADTDLWYITVELRSSEAAGIPHRLSLDIEGFETTSTLPCDRVPGCTFDEELAALDARVAELQPQLDEALGLPTAAAAGSELESLESFIAAENRRLDAANERLVVAESRLAELCAPQQSCTSFPDPGSKAPSWALLAGIAILGWGIYRVVNRLRGSTEKKPKEGKPAGYTPQGMRSAGA